jgi:hypothetical protein
MNSAFVLCRVCQGNGRFVSRAVVAGVYGGRPWTRPRCDPCDGTGMIELSDAPSNVASFLARTLPPPRPMHCRGFRPPRLS